MKNIQIIRLAAKKYRVKMHYTNRDMDAVFTDEDHLLDFIGRFLKQDGMKVSSIAQLKKDIEKAQEKGGGLDP